MCYLVHYRVLPYPQIQSMHMFAPDEKAAVRQVVNVFWKKRIAVLAESVEAI